MAEVLDVTRTISASSISISEVARLEAAFKDGFPTLDARPHIRIWYGDHCYIPESIHVFLSEQSTPEYATRLSIRISDAKTRDEDRYLNGAQLIIGEFSYYHVYANDRAWGGAVLRALEQVFSPMRRAGKAAIGVFAGIFALGAMLQGLRLLNAFFESRQVHAASLEPTAFYDSITGILIVFALLAIGCAISVGRSFQPPKIIIKTDRSTRLWTIFGTLVGVVGLILGIASFVR